MKKPINPILKMDYPDPDVIRVDDTYYMVSTTMYYMPGCVILRSYNLADWEILGYVYDKLDDTPEERMELEKTEYAGGMWAPSFRYHNGEFFIFLLSHSGNVNYLFRSKSPEGPWKKTVVGGGRFHDASFFIDEDGRAYLIHGNTEISITELNAEYSAPKKGGLDRVIVRDGRDIWLGYEGSHFYRIGKYYYLFLIDWPKNGIRTQSCFRAESLDGEFTGGEVLSDTRGIEGRGVAQGGIVDTPDGKWFSVLFQDMGAVGRIPVLLPVSWRDDFPVFGIDGKIPEQMELKSTRPGHKYAPLYVSDSFLPKPELPKDKQLALPWQWNHQPDDRLWELLPGGGLAITTDKICINLTHARNTLTQRMLWPHCAAEVTICADGLHDGDIAGLCALQYCYGMIGIAREGVQYYLVQIVRGNGERDHMAASDLMPGDVIEHIPLEGPVVRVCLKACFEDGKDLLEFSYKKGNHVVKLETSHKMEFRLAHFTGNRFGLCCYSTRMPGGRVVFRDFVYHD
ncbi:MAG: glycoside hydrolase 43 family protein [Lachnospiraceae bacterium]|nr:glycoside hydrolase 43 family protein [Lachnospiraceae bacterium]